jgi:hypothetical protein
MNHNRISPVLASVFIAVAVMSLFPAAAIPAGEPLAVWIRSLTVAPAHTPSIAVVVRNTSDAAFTGQVAVAAPAEWRLEPVELPVSLPPSESRQLRYTVKAGTSRDDNRYPITVTATGSGIKVVHSQAIATASAPYFKPEIDGRTDDWNDAIPVTWVTDNRTTSVRTFWNRRQFSLLVAVDESQLTRPGSAGAPFDAVQLAIAAEESVTGSDPNGQTTRYEFLLVPPREGDRGQPYCLAEPGQQLQLTQTDRPLAPLAFNDAQLAVRREGTTTYYECALPWAKMRDAVAPSEGREFCLSVLVHDPDGTGLRDWGTGAGLPPAARNRLAWSRWLGATWPTEPPFDNKTSWGLCSSKY